MSPDSLDDPESIAVEQLEYFGLSTYAARTFVALGTINIGTAKEISQISDVPRTRVYDAVDELHERGMVDIKQSSPKQFWAISPETTSKKFEQEMRNRTALLTAALDELEPKHQTEEQRGVWTVDGQQAVTERVVEFMETAEEEIVYMTVESLLTDEILEALQAAADRGVSIKIGGVSEDVRTQIQDDIPDCEVFDSLWLWSDTPAGRLMMVDKRKTLVSALVNGTDAKLSDPRFETAVWGESETNSLVVILRAIFTWQMDSAAES